MEQLSQGLLLRQSKQKERKVRANKQALEGGGRSREGEREEWMNQMRFSAHPSHTFITHWHKPMSPLHFTRYSFWVGHGSVTHSDNPFSRQQTARHFFLHIWINRVRLFLPSLHQHHLFSLLLSHFFSHSPSLFPCPLLSLSPLISYPCKKFTHAPFPFL